MAGKKQAWKKGRGRLGVLSPLLGTWKATADSPMGRVTCTRTFAPILGGTRIHLTAKWKFARETYEEVAIYGVGDDKALHFWSFTSDGKRSEGMLADVSDLHPQAIGFEAHMPSGLGRMAYWPDASGGVHWVVEAKLKRGWKRFTEHHYKRV